MKFRKRVGSLLSVLCTLRPAPPRKLLAPCDTTIIVLNWNKRDCTRECLENLERAELNGASILMLANGSSDGSGEAVLVPFPDARVLTLPENALPDIERARREGLTAQVEASVRGHSDGLLDRPVPLEQLGPRPRRASAPRMQAAGAATGE